MTGKDYSNLQVGDKVVIHRFYYATPKRSFEGKVVGLTKLYVKIEFEASYSDIQYLSEIPPKVIVRRFKKDGGHEPYSENRSMPPPTYWLD